jgi:Phospholipase_D-nuclease N-terminal
MATTVGYTFGTLLVWAAVITWIVAWFAGAVDIFRRRDLTGPGKLGWLLVLLVLPVIGLFVYFLFSSRPRTA